MKAKHFFNPEEIIFSATDACNLHCPHCFVSRTPDKLDISAVKNFLASCKGTNINKIGFSGGEPFLYMDFLTEITKYAVENDFMFDQIMTNGIWWKNETDLSEKLNKVYDAGYDGKIGLSWDSFHNQDKEKIKIFVKTVKKIFGEDSINIQFVKNSDQTDWEEKVDQFCTEFNLPVYKLEQTFQSENPDGWQSKKWFKDDYCEGPGNIFFVHPNGKIAPCCGFANENEKLIIGNINQSFSEVMQNAENNQFVKTCFEKGLLKLTKKNRKKLSGKTKDICTACDFLCKIE